jgi:hypothetical protein
MLQEAGRAGGGLKDDVLKQISARIRDYRCGCSRVPRLCCIVLNWSSFNPIQVHIVCILLTLDVISHYALQAQRLGNN